MGFEIELNGRCWGLVGLGFSGGTWLSQLLCGGQRTLSKFHCSGNTFIFFF